MLFVENKDITITNPSEEMERWCDKELVLPNPDYAKKSRMGFWTGNTPRTICLYEKHGDGLVLPYGAKDLISEEIKKDGVWFPMHHVPKVVDFKADIPLYDYQKEAVYKMLKAHSGILQSPAGSGKTQMALALAARLGLRTLWLCHTLDLVKQSKDRAKQYMPKDLIGEISRGKVDIGKALTFATVQTMSNLNLEDYRNEWDICIVDEVHRVSGTPTSITQYRKVLNSLDIEYKYGLSATVHRSDGLIKATYSLIGTVKHVVSEEAVAGRIMQVGIRPIQTGFELNRKCLDTDGMVVYTKLITELTQDGERNRLIVNSIEVGKPSLILSDRLEHLEILLNLLPQNERSRAVMISGKMTSKKGKAEREKALEDMRTGKNKYLFATYSLAKEGLDIPCLERLYMATPQKDYAVVTQAIGRIARTCEGKAKPVCYDFVDDIPMLVRFYKKRCASYRKARCCFINADSK